MSGGRTVSVSDLATQRLWHTAHRDFIAGTQAHHDEYCELWASNCREMGAGWCRVRTEHD